MSLQILMLNYEFPPLGGGAANANFYLLRMLAQHADIKVHLVTSSVNAYRIEHFEQSENITIHYLDIGKKGNLHYQSLTDLLRYSAKALPYCRKLMRQHNFQLVHAFFGIPCGWIARRLGLPYIVSLRGSDVPFYNERFYWLDKLLFRRMSVNIWKKAAFVVANSEGLRRLALQTSPKQTIQVITNGIDTDFFAPPSQRNNNKITIACTARLIQRKGYEYLIQALQGLDARLLVAGDGNMRQQLEMQAQQIGADVVFYGRLEKQAVLNVLQQADVFALPSLNEGMSNSLLEAMACGMAVIVTDTGGSEELVSGNGFVVEKQSATAIKEALQNYINAPTLLHEHQQKSREIALRKSWQNVANDYMALYNFFTT